MSNIKKSITDLIGNTPLVELTNYNKKHNLKGRIIAKIEYFNPLGSSKDRIANAMIEAAVKDGLINNDTVIIEPTSGNTGIGLAFVCATKGLKLILTMPETMSIERILLVQALGAEVILTDGSKGMSGSIEKANDLKKEYGNAFIPQQFENPNNPYIHYQTTGREILRDTDGNISAFVAGVGSGGTISGVGKALKEYIPDIKICAVEPSSSAVMSGESAGAHKIQGIGAGFIPKALDLSVIDEIIKIDNDDAFSLTREIAITDGILVGISSGAALAAATKLAKMNKYTNRNIVVLFPDTGERYLSTELFKSNNK